MRERESKRATMATSPDPSFESSSTVESKRKKRTIVVVRQRENRIVPTVPRKKTLLVSRQPRPSEGRLFDSDPSSISGTGAPLISTEPNDEGIGWHPDGRVIERSILGTAEAFHEVSFA